MRAPFRSSPTSQHQRKDTFFSCNGSATALALELIACMDVSLSREHTAMAEPETDSLRELVQGLLEDTRDLVRAELALAKADAREEVSHAGTWRHACRA